MSDIKKRKCGCVDSDRFECFRRRYRLDPGQDVTVEGGPCECPCHDEEYELYEEIEG